MKTTEKSVMELRKEASDLKVPNYGKMDKVSLIKAIAEAKQKAESPKEEIFTDRHNEAIAINDRVRVQIGNKKPEGVITQMRKIKDDEFAYVLLDGTDKAKMFHTNDIEFVSKGSQPEAPKSKDKITKGPGGKATFISGEVTGDDEPESKPEPKKPAAAKKIGMTSEKGTPAPKPEKKPDTKKSEGKTTVGGFKATKYDEHLKGINLHGIKHDDTVTFTVRKKGGEEIELTGKVKSLIWDTNIKDDNKATFLIKVEGDKTIYFKRIANVKKV